MRDNIVLDTIERHEAETGEDIRLELYRALVAALDQLEGDVRLMALKMVAKAEGCED